MHAANRVVKRFTYRWGFKLRIAVIGAGISGLVVAFRLQSNHDITLFECNDYLGGHTNTVDVEEGERQLAIDTGFIVFNDRTYPNFIELLNEWQVDYQKTVMSFSVRCDRTGLEYRGADFNGLFAQRRNLFNPKFLRLLYDLIRFKKIAEPLLLDQGDDRESVESFLYRHRFSESFIEQYFIPMGSAIWSCPRGKFLNFPIQFIAEFYQNHGLLGVSQRPQWYVIRGGSREYVRKLSRLLDCDTRLNTRVDLVARNENSAKVYFGDNCQEFDQVVFACHADQALRILGDGATNSEREILSAFPFEKNVATLHTQTDVLPKSRRAWAAWNYHRGIHESDHATVTYDMNILQSLKTNKEYCVTLNDDGKIKDENIIRQISYAHPIFDLRRKSMQRRHLELIATNQTSFCGAYWGNGFHEDGVKSGLAVVEKLANMNVGSATNHA